MKNQIRKNLSSKITLVLVAMFMVFSTQAGETPIANNLNKVFSQPQVNPFSNFKLYQPTVSKFRLNLQMGQQPWLRASDKPYKRKSPFLASALNFVLPGAGYLYNGQKHPLVSIGMMAGAVGLTYVELNLKDQAPDLYPIMFGSVLVLNTSIAIDTFFKTKQKNEAHNL